MRVQLMTDILLLAAAMTEIELKKGLHTRILLLSDLYAVNATASCAKKV